MSRKAVKIAVVCVILVGLGISFRLVQRPGTVSCNAEDAANIAGREAASEAPEKKGIVPGKYDFSDISHWNLTVSAWESLAGKDFEGVFAYANKCLELYEPKAKEMAVGMKSFSRPGHEDEFALVNDVATSHYVMGEAYMKLGRAEDALKEFKYVIANYPYAQCWDPKGWFWKVSEVSGKNIDKLAKENAAKPEGLPK